MSCSDWLCACVLRLGCKLMAKFLYLCMQIYLFFNLPLRQTSTISPTVQLPCLLASSPKMMHAVNESCVLVIYCGGTIGMLKSDKQGYVPEPFYLTETLRAQSRFHDPHEDSLFSHSSTVQGFRKWSKSGSSTPLQIPLSKASESHPMHTLLVRSSRPITSLPGFSDFPTSSSCTPISDNCYEARLPSLVTPVGLNGLRIRYAVLEVSSHPSIHKLSRVSPYVFSGTPFLIAAIWSPLTGSGLPLRSSSIIPLMRS